MENKNIKVLAIDDNPDNLITIKALVMEAFPDAMMLTALNGSKGIELAASENPDVILLDVVMPGMDGFAVCEKLKADKMLSDIPVVFVTAIKGDKESRIRALEVGAEAFLAKPIDETELVAQIRAMVKVKTATILKRDETARLTDLVGQRTQELEKTHTATLNLLEDLKKEVEARSVTEKALLASEEKFRFMTENSTDVVWHVDANFLCDYISPADERMRGFTKDDVIGHSLFEILKPETVEMLMHANRLRLIDESKSIRTTEANYQLEQICKDGSWIWVEASVSPHRNENGEIIGYHGVTRNITERKKSEAALLESEEKYRFLFANNPQPMFIYDLETLDFIEVNKSAVNHYGYSREEFLSMSIKDIRPQEDVPALLEDIENSKAITSSIHGWRHLKKNGELIFVEVTSVLLLSNGRQARQILVNDVTERKLAEENMSHIARLYALHSEVNQAIIKCKNQNELFDTICSVAIEYGQFRMGWIAIYDEVSGELKANNSAGYVGGYLDLLHIFPGSKTFGLGPTGRAFAEGKTMFCNDVATDLMMKPWRIEALKRNYLSSFATPIFRKGRPYGTFTLYASESGFFNIDEQKLLSEIGENISYAIDAIDSETVRKKAQQDLEVSEVKYRNLMENSPEGITIYVDGKIAYVNKESIRLMKANKKEDLIGKTIVDFIHPDNQALVLERMQYVAMAPLYSIIPSVEEKYIRLDGTEVFVEIKVMPIMFEGKFAMQLSGHDISDRKEAEFALADTMSELKTIYDNSPVMMCVVDDNADIQFANQAFAQLSDSIMTELRGEQVGNVVGCIAALETDQGCGYGKLCGKCGLRGAMLNTLRSGIGLSNIEHKSTLIRSGEKVEVYLLASTAIILTGKSKRLLLCLVDITARKHAEDALQKSELFLRTFINNIPFQVWARDVNNIGILENTRSVDDFESILGKTPLDYSLVDSKITHRWLSNNKRVLKGESINQEVEYEQNKRIHAFQEIVFPIYNKKEIIGIAGFNIDISDKKRAEQALRDSEDKYRMLFNANKDSITIVNFDEAGMPFQFVEMNDAAADSFGFLREDLLFHKLSDVEVLLPIDQMSTRMVALKSKGRVDFETVIKDKTGKERHLEVKVVLINYKNQPALMNISRDITRRKLAEIALNNTQQQLKQFAAHLQEVREEEKKLLAREIHDELGQILVALKIDLGLLKQKVYKKLENTGAEEVLTKFEHLYVLVDDTIKTTRKIMTNLRPEVLDLLGFIEAVKLYSNEFQERHKINCEFSCCISKLELNSQQAVALFRIVQESLTNVAKHSKATDVTITLAYEDNTLMLEIIDNGIGFDENHKGRTDSYGMIGMKERVFLLEGELNIIGKLGEGTTVRIELPYKKEPLNHQEECN